VDTVVFLNNQLQTELKLKNVQTLTWHEYSELAAEHHVTHDGLIDVTRAFHNSGMLMWYVCAHISFRFDV
jgi:hypothetical protein